MKKITSWLSKYGFWILIIIGTIFGLYRLGYYIYSIVPLGYDPGMYKEIFTNYISVIENFDFSLLASRIRHEPLLGIISAILNKVGISFDWMITRGIGFANLIPGFILFFWFKRKKQGRVGAIIAFLYWTSIVQYEIFWWNYCKQIIAIILMLSIFIFGDKRRDILQSILFFLLILLHRHTAIFTGGALIISLIYRRVNEKRIPRKNAMYLFISGIAALLAYIPIWDRVMPEAIKAVNNAVGGNTMGGDFIGLVTYIKLQWPIIILSLVGFGITLKNKIINNYSFAYVIGWIWILFGLINFNRTIVFLDIFVVVFAGFALIHLIKFSKKIGIRSVGILFTSIILIGISINYLGYVATNNIPLISEDEFLAIKNIHNITEDNAIVFNTHRSYSPWIMGRSQREYINPGMSDSDLWTHDQWNSRWGSNGETKCNMLYTTYHDNGKPMYLWLGEKQFKENLMGGDCFNLVISGDTWQLYKIKFN